MGRWIRISVVGLVVVGLMGGALVLLGWTVSETRFARPEAGFDREAARLEALPGVRVASSERWVEAPTFSPPQAWMEVEVDAAHLPEMLAAVCETGYPGTLAWSLVVHADAGTTVTVHTQGPGGHDGTDARCVEPGFDLPGLVEAAARLVPGTDLQPSLRDDGSFALADVAGDAGGIRDVLPLVAHADELRDAAGLDADRLVLIDSMTVGITMGPDEHERWPALLDGLVTEDGITSISADDGSTQIDGLAKVQVAAPEGAHAAVTARVRSSGLSVAGYPVRFLPDDGQDAAGR